MSLLGFFACVMIGYTKGGVNDAAQLSAIVGPLAGMSSAFYYQMGRKR